MGFKYSDVVIHLFVLSVQNFNGEIISLKKIWSGKRQPVIIDFRVA